jgi:hypothetical protein
MIIDIDNRKYDIILHDLMHVAEYMHRTGQHFDEVNMEMYRKRLMEIKEELRENTETKDD